MGLYIRALELETKNKARRPLGGFFQCGSWQVWGVQGPSASEFQDAGLSQEKRFSGSKFLTTPQQGLPGPPRASQGHIGVILGLYRDNGTRNGSYYNILGCRGYIGIMEKKMETTI